jgi:flagellar hook-associated protein 3 FlgL
VISSFYPAVAGRVSDGLTRHRSLYQVQTDQIALQKLQTQLSTGNRYQSVSESPTSAIRVIGLQREQEFKSQTLVNLKSAQGYLSSAETSLAEVQDITNELNSLALEGVSTLVSENERKVLVRQLDTFLERLTSIANLRTRDRYLFAGSSVQTPPLAMSTDGQSARFRGDNLDLLAIADQQSYLAHNISSQRALGLVSADITGTTDLNPALNLATRLDDLRLGQGIPRGGIHFSDGNQTTTIDLASAETLADVVDQLNQVSLSGRSLSATLSPTGIDVQYADGLPGTLRISDLSLGTTAKALGIATSVPQPLLPIQGSDLNPIVRKTTPISQLLGGTGLDLNAGLKIVQGGRSFVVDTSQATTVEDLLNTINQSGAGVQAELAADGQRLTIRSTESGTDFAISEHTGGLASALGIRTFNGQTRLADLNHGQGLELIDGHDLVFTRSDGTEFGVDLNGAVTIDDVIQRVNNAPTNQDPNLKITLSLQSLNNGLAATASVPPSAPPPSPAPTAIAVRSAGGSSAGRGLGLVPPGSVSATATTNGGNYEVLGSDPNPRETPGVFNSVLRLRNAIRDGDQGQISRVLTLIRQDIDRLSLARGDIGSRQQRVDALINANEDRLLQLQSQESDERDVELAEVISELSARQVAYEANLRLLSQANRASLFDYL